MIMALNGYSSSSTQHLGAIRKSANRLPVIDYELTYKLSFHNKLIVEAIPAKDPLSNPPFLGLSSQFHLIYS